MKVNPRTITWVPPTQWTDNTPFTAADFAGYEFAYSSPDPNDAWMPVVAVPVSFDQTSLDISSLQGLPQREEFELAMRTVAYNGTVSDWGVAPETLVFDARTPRPPLALSVV